MRAKHNGVAILALAGLSGLGCAAVIALQLLLPTAEPPLPGLRLPQASTVQVPEIPAGARGDMERLYARLGELARPRGRAGGEVNYALLGFSQSLVAVHEDVALGPTERFSKHVITMAYVSGDRRYAVIDGRLYSEGERLEGSSGTVRTITPTKVLIAGKEVRQWVEVFNPEAPQPPAQAEGGMAGAEGDAVAAVGGLPPRKEDRREEESKARTSEAIEALKGFAEALELLQTTKEGVESGRLGSR